MKLNLNRTSLIPYLFFIPFLYPKGLSWIFSWYKNFMTLWLYTALVFALAYLLWSILWRQVFFKPCIYLSFAYFLTLCLITFIIRGTLANGLQKIFAAPILLAICSIQLRKNPGSFLQVINNIMIANLALNLIMLLPFLPWRMYFNPGENTSNALGHIQVNAQFGIIAVLLSYLEYRLYPEKKLKYIVLSFLSIVTMAISTTDASWISILILLAFWLAENSGLSSVAHLSAKTYFLGYLLINLVFFIYSMCGGNMKFLIFSLNGRNVIWREVLSLISRRMLFGYGAHGIEIRVSWRLTGMSYAHNQLLQVCLEGGLTLTVIFLFMMLAFLKNIDSIQDRKLQAYANACLTVMLMIMIVEPMTEYLYVFIMLAVISYLSEIEMLSARNAGIMREYDVPERAKRPPARRKRIVWTFGTDKERFSWHF